MTISRAEYEAKREHGQAGTGTPLEPAKPGYWVMAYDPLFGTVLYTGVKVEP